MPSEMKKIIFSLLSILYCLTGQTQMTEFIYKRPLLNIENQWHKIVLPDGLYQKSQHNLADIRVYGITKNNDTIEAPYILKALKGKTLYIQKPLRPLNQSSVGGRYYYSFQNKSLEVINELSLNFDPENFDFKVSLQGSQDQKNWQLVVNKKRVAGIQNEFGAAKFTKISFPDANFPFFRLTIESQKDPKLQNVSFSKKTIIEGVYSTYKVKKIQQTHNKKSNATILMLELEEPLLISNLKINIADDFDYSRPMLSYYANEKLRTIPGCDLECSLKVMHRSLVSSQTDNNFDFPAVISNNIKIVIENKDNSELKINSVEVSGYVNELHARFTKEADYFLVYGNETVRKPSYDISLFAKNIPNNLTAISLGEEINMQLEKANASAPKKNYDQLLMWIVCTALALIIGWSTIKMIRKESTKN